MGYCELFARCQPPRVTGALRYERMSATPYPAYQELIDFLAGGITPEELIAFRPSPQVQSRIVDLVERQRDGRLTDEDSQELTDYLQLEHLMTMAKAQARRRVCRG